MVIKKSCIESINYWRRKGLLSPRRYGRRVLGIVLTENGPHIARKGYIVPAGIFIPARDINRCRNARDILKVVVLAAGEARAKGAKVEFDFDLDSI